MVFAVALITLGASSALGKAPRARRTVVTHIVTAGALAALSAPFVLTELLAAAGERHAGDGAGLPLSMSLAMTPLALLLGLPIALISGVVFAWVALARGRIGEGDLIDFRNDNVQPFR
jgi:hypothetical protein